MSCRVEPGVRAAEDGPQRSLPDPDVAPLGNPRAVAIDAAAEHWHLATIKPNGIWRALSNIADIDWVIAYAPRLVLRHTRTERVVVPLFPGYLLLRFDATTQPWGALRSVPGLAQLLLDASGLPQTIMPTIMAALLDRPERYADGVQRPVATAAPGSDAWRWLGSRNAPERLGGLHRAMR